MTDQGRIDTWSVLYGEPLKNGPSNTENLVKTAFMTSHCYYDSYFNKKGDVKALGGTLHASTIALKEFDVQRYKGCA